jgi:hypothetical protein
MIKYWQGIQRHFNNPNSREWIYNRAIYINSSSDKSIIEVYIANNLKEITDWFKNRDLEFIYFSENSISNIDIDKIRYNFPNLTENEIHNLANQSNWNLNTKEFTDLLINPIVMNKSDSPVILGFRDINNCAFSINLSEHESLNEVDFLIALERLINDELYINYSDKIIPSPVKIFYSVSENEVDSDGISFNKSGSYIIDPIEDNLDAEMQSAIQEIKEKIDLLSLNGLEEFKIKLLINKYISDKYNKLALSKLYIDSSFRISLTDYENTEIELSPILKTVYFLFLLNPKGIRLKEIGSYFDLLLEIYNRLSRFESQVENEKIIKELCHPLCRSLNEKLSKIKKIFLTMYCDEIAKNYYITGERGMFKEISITKNKGMVQFSEEISFDNLAIMRQ